MMQKAKNEAYKELLIESPNRQKVDSLFEASGKFQIQLDKMTFDHFAKLRTLCTKEQVPVFDRLFQDLMFKFRGSRRTSAFSVASLINSIILNTRNSL